MEVHEEALKPVTDIKEENRRIFDSQVHCYLGRELIPAEQYLLRFLRGRWHAMDVLDLGVGAGRTAYTLSAIAKTYVGVDYSPRMIEMCRSAIGETETTKFVLQDCCDLSCFAGRKFDLILFSFHGIDSVGHEDRLKIIGEVSRLLEPESGWFYFSTHNLNVYPFPLGLPPFSITRPLRSAYCYAYITSRHLFARALNRRMNSETARRRGWAVLYDPGGHTWTQSQYYIAPGCQVAQCEAAGLDVVEVISWEGKRIKDRRSTMEGSLHYFCRLEKGKMR